MRDNRHSMLAGGAINDKEVFASERHISIIKSINIKKIKTSFARKKCGSLDQFFSCRGSTQFLTGTGYSLCETFLQRGNCFKNVASSTKNLSFQNEPLMVKKYHM